MSEDWLGRWATGRTGWHETDGNAGLKAYWPAGQLSGGNRQRVLVPFCGKSLDLLWLIHQEYEVVGVELAEVAVRQFFAENDLEFEVIAADSLQRFVAKRIPLSILCGDYFDFSDTPFDALYDRGALVALQALFRRLGVVLTRKAIEKSVPFGIGVALSGTGNYALTGYVGRQAMAWFELTGSFGLGERAIQPR